MLKRKNLITVPGINLAPTNKQEGKAKKILAQGNGLDNEYTRMIGSISFTFSHLHF